MLDQELRELDENLVRAELTPLERAQCLKRRKEIWEFKQRERESAQSGGGNTVPTTSHAGHKQGFAAETAAQTGLSKRAINKDLRRADAIAGDVQETIRHAAPDMSGSDLDALASAKPDQQREAVRQVAEGITSTVRQALDPTGKSARLPPNHDPTGKGAQLRNVADRLLAKQTADLSATPQAKDGGLMELRTAWRKATISAQRKFVSELERDGHLDAPEPQKAVG